VSTFFHKVAIKSFISTLQLLFSAQYILVNGTKKGFDCSHESCEEEAAWKKTLSKGVSGFEFL